MSGNNHMSGPTLRAWLEAEPFTLSLSAGFFGFYAHTGVLAALERSGISPDAARGCSAGALVTGLWASGRTANDMRDLLLSVRREDFWDPALGFGLLRGGRFRDILNRELAVRAFSETKLPLTVSVFDVKRRRTRALSHGELAPAIQASCTFPGLFHPVVIDGRPHIDGGVADRAGHHGMPSGTRVLYHHLSSRSHTRKRVKHSLARTGPNMVTLVCRGLPAVSPFHLDRGPKAFYTAYEAFSRALDAPAVTDSITAFG